MDGDFFIGLAGDAADRGLSFLVVGGHALNAHGYQRTTLDADLLVPDGEADAWQDYWEGKGYHCINATEAFRQFAPPQGIAAFPVDLLVVDDQTFERLNAYGEQRRIGGAELRVPDPLHLVALKLHALRHAAAARREKDLGDILGLIRACGMQINSGPFLDVLRRYADEQTRTELLRRLGQA